MMYYGVLVIVCILIGRVFSKTENFWVRTCGIMLLLTFVGLIYDAINNTYYGFYLLSMFLLMTVIAGIIAVVREPKNRFLVKVTVRFNLVKVNT